MIETINLNLIPDTTELPVLHCSQFDDGRIMYADLFEGDQPFILAEGSVVKVNIRKLDNNVISNVCTYETIENEFSRVTITATEQMTACYGRSYGELQISVNDTVIGTLNFYFDVERDPMQGGIDSASEIDNLTSQIEDIVEEVIGDDYYNKSQVDDLLDGKADTSDLDNYYTKSQADTLLAGKVDDSDLDNYYTKSQADTLLSGKVDNSTLNNYYTKTEVDQKFLDIMPVKTITKSPVASFYTSIGNYPIVDMTCYINPTQSGSGDPYPAGGGKNKFDCNANYNLPINNQNGVTVTLGDDGLLHFSGTCSTNFSIYGINQSYYGVVGTPIKFTIFGASETLVCVPFKNNNSTTAITTDGGTSTTLANTESDVFYLRIDLKAGTNYTGKTLGIVFSLASETITSFIPYSNIRPITGVSSVNLFRTGASIVEVSDKTGSINNGYFYSFTTGYTLQADVTYTLTMVVNTTVEPFAISVGVGDGSSYRADIAYTEIVNRNGVVSITFTPTSANLQNWNVLWFRAPRYSTPQELHPTTCTFTITNISLVTSVDTYTIALGGTYYGATLDVTRGKLSVTHANIASYNGEQINEPWLSSMDKYVSGATPTTGAQVVYPLTTPIEIDLTPTQINSLLGSNNIWHDGNGDIELKFKETIQDWIDQQ